MKLLRHFAWYRHLVLARRRKQRKYHLDARWNFDQSVLSCIGLYVTVWAGVERMLNEFIVAYHPHRAALLKVLPSDLQAKVKYLAEVGKDERLPLALRIHFSEIAAALGRESGYRHNLVHGYGYRKRMLGNMDWTFQWLDLRAKEPRLVKETYSHDEMARRLKAICAVSAQSAGFLTPILFPQLSSTSRP